MIHIKLRIDFYLYHFAREKFISEFLFFSINKKIKFCFKLSRYESEVKVHVRKFYIMNLCLKNIHLAVMDIWQAQVRWSNQQAYFYLTGAGFAYKLD